MLISLLLNSHFFLDILAALDEGNPATFPFPGQVNQPTYASDVSMIFEIHRTVENLVDGWWKKYRVVSRQRV